MRHYWTVSPHRYQMTSSHIKRLMLRGRVAAPRMSRVGQQPRGRKWYGMLERMSDTTIKFEPGSLDRYI